MTKLSILCTVLITFYGAINSKLVASTDNKNNTLELSVSELTIASDNICSNYENNIAVDVILVDNKPFNENERAFKNVNKRQAPNDKRKEFKDRPRPDQKSLLIIFDGTGSMHDDLQQLRSGAQEIINDLSSRDDNPIYNYVLVVFRDPTIEQPFETRNPTELMEKLKYINVVGGGDCPEMALSGLKFGLKLALPNSFAYVFSDASSKDHQFYDEVVALIQKKQVTVNFLLTGDCKDSNNIKYKVYEKLSRVSNGQVYDMKKSNVKDVLLAIRDTVKPNYAALKSVDVEQAGVSKTDLNVDNTISELKVSIAGKNPTLSIRDPANETIKASEELSLNNLRLVNIKDPIDGIWHIEAGAESSHSIRLSALSDIKFDFGFSLDDVEKKSETAFQPLIGHKNILTLFVSDPSLINVLSNITIILVPTSPLESLRQFTIPLKERKDNVYATKPFDVPKQMFKIQLNGFDANGNAIERLISTGLISSQGSAPELNIEANQKEIYEGDRLHLKCTVKSHIPVNITWSFGSKTLDMIYSNQSNELELTIQNVQREHHGTYKCLAVNSISKEIEEISINILTIPKVSIRTSSLVMEENLNYSLNCIIEDTKEQKIEINWTDENGNLMQKGGKEYSFTADHRDNGKKIKCKVQNNDFAVEDEITLKVNYQPRFVNQQVQENLKLVYGSNVTFDCATIENPKKNSSNWFFTGKNSNGSRIVMDNSNETLSISELLEEHEGIYECVVTNEVGEVKREFSIGLIPKESPKISTKNIIIAKEGENVELSCECRNCLPLANFSWTYDNIGSYEKFFIKNQEENFFKTIMKFSNVDENDNGTFYCSMWNDLGEDEVAIDLLVQTIPKIDGIILNNEDYDEERVAEVDEKFEVLEGKNFSVECIVADTYPEPTTYWMRNNKKITNESVLTIDSVLVTDEGNYECFAENDLGVTKKGFQVDVKYPPRRKREVETSYEVPKDDNVILKCDLIGNPSPKISWQLNSKEINSNEKYQIEENILKFIANADDSGIYKCNGTNKFGHSAIDFSVMVMNPPQMLDPNDVSLKFKINSTLKLHCDATGYPLPSIKFLRNNDIVSNESNYEIKAVTSLDAGNYNCIAENQIGQIEKIFYVLIVEEPKILSVFDNATIINNNTIEVNCTATGLPKPIITWKHDDKEIGNSTDSLILDSSFNSGKVSCHALNSEGSDEKYLYVDVVKMPIILPTAKTVNTEIKLKENDNLELECPFENFNNLAWSLNGQNLEAFQYKELDGKIFITHVNKTHNGTWTCTASNVAGEDTFSYDVNVLIPPKIFASWNLNDSITDFLYSETDIDEKVLKKGEKLILNCTVDGSPLPKIQWRKGTDIFGEGEILTIDNLHFHHSDIYSCIAESSQGNVKKFFKVDVTSAPYIDNTISLQTQFQKMIGDSVILKCNSIIANPSPLHFWFKDSEILDDEADDTLIIEHLKATDSGKYRCLAKNKLGSAKIEYEISIYQPSKILTISKESAINEDSLKLSCTSQGNPLPIIAWTLNGHILSTTSKMNVEKLFRPENDNTIYFDGFGNGISLLDPFQLKVSKHKFYSKLSKIDSNTLKLDLIFKNKKNLHLNKYICYSFNGLGKDEKSIEIQIKQKPHLETQAISKISDYEILEQMPLLLNCPIQGFPQPQINWFKNGFKVYENETLEFLKDQQFLRISEAFSWNSGSYSCIAKNEEGESELKFNVLVLSPPKIVKQPNANYISDENRENSSSNENEERIDVLKGSNVILECTVEASPKAKVHWVKLNFQDSIKGNEILKTEENFLALNSLQESSNFMCYANNTIGNIQKYFFINVQYPPALSGNGKSEEYLTVKLHHSINLECHTKASPEAIIYWSFNSTNLTRTSSDYYFSTDNQIMRITNANRNHEGKYLCTSANNLGWIQKVFYIKLEIPIQYSPWSEWSDCSSSCGSNGVQYRSRTCVLLDAIPSYNCSGENVQVRKCNDIPCPINGGWSNWTEWNDCPACHDTQLNKKSKQKRYRKCDSPFPAFGGLNCDGNGEEEKECKLSPCPVDGKWSEWSSWSLCSKSCGKGFKNRKRFCNSPSPMHNGKSCDGENSEYEECKIRACSNYAMIKSLNNRYNDESTERYEEFSDFGIMNDQNGKPKMYKYMQHREMEYSPPVQDRNGLKVKITLDTYKPISAETYNSHMNNLKPNVANAEDIDQIDDYFETDSFESIESTESTLRVTTEKNCGQGFKYNQVYKQCEEVDECKSKELNTCNSNERCINTIGSYRCEKLFN